MSGSPNVRSFWRACHAAEEAAEVVAHQLNEANRRLALWDGTPAARYRMPSRADLVSRRDAWAAVQRAHSAAVVVVTAARLGLAQADVEAEIRAARECLAEARGLFPAAHAWGLTAQEACTSACYLMAAGIQPTEIPLPPRGGAQPAARRSRPGQR
jgi:hypothetical protein